MTPKQRKNNGYSLVNLYTSTEPANCWIINQVILCPRRTETKLSYINKNISSGAMQMSSFAIRTFLVDSWSEQACCRLVERVLTAEFSWSVTASFWSTGELMSFGRWCRFSTVEICVLNFLFKNCSLFYFRLSEEQVVVSTSFIPLSQSCFHGVFPWL